MRTFLPIVLAIAAAIVKSPAGQAEDRLIIAVAASMQSAFDELVTAYGAQATAVITPVFGASGKLAAQIRSGAPYALFLSADESTPIGLAAEGLTLAQPKIYALGSLILWTTRAIDLTSGAQILTSDRVRHIAIANPKLAPYGKEAELALTRLGVFNAIKSKIVTGESIGQVNQFVRSGSVDVGITSRSAITARGLPKDSRWIALPPNTYEPIRHAFVVLKSRQSASAAAFGEFLLSARAREILVSHGYDVPK